MQGFGPSTYGERVAGVYDERYGDNAPFSAERTAAALTRLAAGGPVLELGVGTGRIALPLLGQGIAVHGIDASDAMVGQLREKPGSEEIQVTMGDFAEVPVPGRYPLVFAAFNTFFGLLSAEHQQRCFTNVAAHLTDGGRFAIEVAVPDLSRFQRDQRISVRDVGVDSVLLYVARHDPQAQRIDSQHVTISRAGIELVPVVMRYAWPAELDVMATAAGLRLQHRWANWDGGPCAGDSPDHVSVYERRA